MRIRWVLIIVCSLAVAWGGANWFIAKSSKQHFDLAIKALSSDQMASLVELEVLSYEETLLGATAALRLTSVTTLLSDELDQQVFTIERRNGPFLINNGGIEFGLAQWQLGSADPSVAADNGVAPITKSVASVVLDFSKKAALRVEIPSFQLKHVAFKGLVLAGEMDLSSFQHALALQVSDFVYRAQRFSVLLPSFSLNSQNTSPLDSDATAMSFTRLSSLGKGEVIFPDFKKIPLDLQTYGSIWINNDTLNSDWQINTVSKQLSGTQMISSDIESDSVKADITVQFRDILVSGFQEYLHGKSEVFSLLQQAEWAMEDIETPEEQDFLRSLFLDAERIQQSNALKPFLIAKRSQVAVNALVTNSSGGTPSQLSLGGNAVIKHNQPMLMLAGQVRVVRSMLNNSWLTLLNKWEKRKWFRDYETEFESDVSVHNQRFLLNNFVVSVDGLGAELSQTLIDQ